MDGQLQEKRVLCKACWSGGQTSKVFVHFSDANLGEGSVFYDEEGRMHSHVVTGFENKYKCSRGHSWIETNVTNKCWCGWIEDIKT